MLLVVDEAYAEYVTEPDWESALDLARGSANLVVTRTFSKIHGLAGLRVGFGYAPPAIAAAVDRIRLPFNNAIPAQEAAIAAFERRRTPGKIARAGASVASAPDPGDPRHGL